MSSHRIVFLWNSLSKRLVEVRFLGVFKEDFALKNGKLSRTGTEEELRSGIDQDDHIDGQA